MFALSSAEATPTTALPVSTPSVTGWVYVVFGGVSSLMVKGVRRTTLAFPSLSRSRAMAGTQGIKGLPSGVRTYTRHINRSLSEKCSAVTSRWCVSVDCDHQQSPASSRQRSKGFLHLDHRTFPGPT